MRAHLAIVMALLLAGCGQEAFTLSENAAVDRLMATKHVAALQRALPTRRVVCRVDSTTPDAVDLHLGDDEGDHTTRIGFYRVTGDGRVWVNRDETGAENLWAVIE